MTYAPRFFWLAPGCLLLPLAVFVDPKQSLPINAVLVLVMTIWGLEWNFPNTRGVSERAKTAMQLKIVSCNINKFQRNPETAIAELDVSDPDLVILQEAIGNSLPKKLLARFPDFHLHRASEFTFLSRYPVQPLEECRVDHLRRVSAAAAKIEGPAGDFVVVNLHTWSARHGLKRLLRRDIAGLKRYQTDRAKEMKMMKQFVDRVVRDQPAMVVGDFNTPTSSRLYRQSWKSWTNAFDVAGWGLGYTAPCDGGDGMLLDGMVWIRIDHILVNDAWEVESIDLGSIRGSDHRVVRASLRLVDSQ